MTDYRTARLTRLSLTGFRNYSTLTLPMAARMVAFVGPNGAGKTNILEAISFLTAGRGLRRAALADIARKDGDGSWSVAATVLLDGFETKIGTGLVAGTSGRKVRIDGEEVRGSESLLDYMRVLWLVPSMDGLFTGPGSDRRRFLDRLTLAIDPTHGRRVSDFENALRQRNRLLDQGGSDAFLSALEQQVAELGTAVSIARAETVDLLSRMIAGQAAQDLPFPHASVSLDGAFEAETAGLSASDREDRYRQMLQDGRHRDRAAGRTLNGPHLSDLTVHHAAKAMPASQSSTGEQKALLIGLILAHAELTAKVSGMTPVLLLDEVAAHLDPDRRSALFSKLDSLGGQVFMTGTDEALFEALPAEAEVFEIREHQGRLLKRGEAP
ncbi:MULTISPECIES: DNA replication/repair protein RecF [Roseibium]|uniref:DNA replication and repair protein RecF n=1 Tax=Roseibium aggregatum TaxID=187304 RepID=A0A0M6Y5I2_9HYPH|nr:DNA replication/repair protein RecF [Roseibium aggregatum]CTQ44271.1 DNA replication and repair protein RecF [Roseibium aggregatum]